MPPPTNIRVSVQWKQPTIFAGEEVECTITFRNVASVPGSERAASQSAHVNGTIANEDRRRRLPQLYARSRASVSRNSSISSHLPEHQTRGHKPAPSLSSPSSTNGHAIPPQSGDTSGPTTVANRAGRSLSIKSMGTEAGTLSKYVRAPTEARRPGNGHSRASSLQVVPRKGSGGAPGMRAAPFGQALLLTL